MKAAVIGENGLEIRDIPKPQPKPHEVLVRVRAVGINWADASMTRGMPYVMRLGYGLPLGVARQWGLYLSASRGKTSIGIEEPALFSEPGVFIVRPDGTLYYGAVQTMPFARPGFADLVAAIDFAVAKSYPARGEYTGAV